MVKFILPADLLGRELHVVKLLHPRSKRPAKYLSMEDGVWELNCVCPTSASHPPGRSALLDPPGIIYSDASLVVATPINPAFLLLPSLWDSRTTPRPLSLIINFTATDGARPVPLNLALQAAHTLCGTDRNSSNTDPLVVLDLTLLEAFLKQCIRSVDLPKSLTRIADRRVAPVNPLQLEDEELRARSREYARFELVSSWLPPAVAQWLSTKFNFTELLSVIERIAQELALSRQTKMQEKTARNFSKKDAKKPSSKKRALDKPTGNQSIVDMLKRSVSKRNNV